MLSGVNTHNYKWILGEYFSYCLIFQFSVFSLSIGYRKNLLKKENEAALKQNIEDQQTIMKSWKKMLN